jgi:hypothetical protein
MPTREHGSEAQLALEQALGYLNFSSGATDVQFLANLNSLFAAAEARSDAQRPWRTVTSWLRELATERQGQKGPFHDVQQALAVLHLLEEHVLPGYRDFHRDVLGHCTDRELFNSFFVGRASEVVLRLGPPWDEPQRIAAAAVSALNDYVGYRPVPILESRKIEPYPHERLRPVPLFIAGAGVAVGHYRAVVEACLQLLRETDDALLREACFDPSLLDELALDPRPYDFDHPANKRPNHHFGQWDPRSLDNRGVYRRFVVQKVTIDALLRRVAQSRRLPEDELLTEAAAVLGGTILMASGISGYGPETHDSTTTLANLLPRIAAYRDAFYESLLKRVSGVHGARLRQEARLLHQPFGGARQDLNQQLTRQRAAQLERVQLARVFAQMDCAAQAEELVAAVDVPSARLCCRIDCLMSAAQRRLERDDLSGALGALQQAEETLDRGIACGAIVDPWNILGFDGNFSLFPALENSIRDLRIDELVERMECLFQLYARLWGAAAAGRHAGLAEQIAACFESRAAWWHRFAAHEVSSVAAEDSLELYQASQQVARALQQWQAAGAATGDFRFWASHVADFGSCRAHSLVVETLLDRKDYGSALGVMIYWLSQSERIALEHAGVSFHELAQRWLVDRLRQARCAEATSDKSSECWQQIRKFFDYVEANAGDYWHVPDFDPGSTASAEGAVTAADDDEADEEDDLYRAAYEDVVYRDSTDDGFDGSLFDVDQPSEDQLQVTSHEIVQRLTFLDSLAAMWKLTAIAGCAVLGAPPESAEPPACAQDIQRLLTLAARHIQRFQEELQRLLSAVAEYRLSRPSGDPESMVQYDRLRLIKESLLEEIIDTQVRLREAGLFVLATSWSDVATGAVAGPAPAEERLMARLMSAALRGNPHAARECWPRLRAALQKQPILYVPLTRGGQPAAIAATKSRQQMLKNALLWLPRLGLIWETFDVLELARSMERAAPVGPGAVTEFDDLFDVGCRSLVQVLVRAHPPEPSHKDAPEAAPPLIGSLNELIEPLLHSWLSHSRTLRLSVLEQVSDRKNWQELVRFIRRYGGGLFTQRFLNLGNIRGILHQGVGKWIARLKEQPQPVEAEEFLSAIDGEIRRDEAVFKLTLILEAIVESYAEYRDYNSTTTQSDRGDQLHTLLDFLRLRTSYDRVVWNLRPVVLAHQVLVRNGCDHAAVAWRKLLEERIGDEAKRHLRRLTMLQKKHAMHLPSVSERLHERFVRPLLVDRVCAMVEPAMRSPDEAQRKRALEVIGREVAALLEQPGGAGLDLPSWLIALEDEVHRVRSDHLLTPEPERLLLELACPPQVLSQEQVHAQVARWQTPDESPPA